MTEPEERIIYVCPEPAYDPRPFVELVEICIDDDLDEPLPPRVCGDGETCESCQ